MAIFIVITKNVTNIGFGWVLMQYISRKFTFPLIIIPSCPFQLTKMFLFSDSLTKKWRVDIFIYNNTHKSQYCDQQML